MTLMPLIYQDPHLTVTNAVSSKDLINPDLDYTAIERHKYKQADILEGLPRELNLISTPPGSQ